MALAYVLDELAIMTFLINHGLLLHPISYVQTSSSTAPDTIRELENRGYKRTQYYWLHIPTGKSGTSVVWVGVSRWADLLICLWNQLGGRLWKYSTTPL